MGFLQQGTSLLKSYNSIIKMFSGTLGCMYLYVNLYFYFNLTKSSNKMYHLYGTVSVLHVFGLDVLFKTELELLHMCCI